MRSGKILSRDKTERCTKVTFPKQDENFPFVARSAQDLLVSVLTITWTFQRCWDGKWATLLSRTLWLQPSRAWPVHVSTWSTIIFYLVPVLRFIPCFDVWGWLCIMYSLRPKMQGPLICTVSRCMILTTNIYQSIWFVRMYECYYCIFCEKLLLHMFLQLCRHIISKKTHNRSSALKTRKTQTFPIFWNRGSSKNLVDRKK
jgi:hypothetical protein